MAMSAAHKRYREKNPPHKKKDDEKRLDQIISAAAMAALAAKCKAAGVTRRQMLEAMALSDWHYHTGVMVMTDITPVLPEAVAGEDITPVLSDEPETADSGIESRILKMAEGGFKKGETSPVIEQAVELYNGDYRKAAKEIRKFANKCKGTPMYENLKTLVNRIDGRRSKIK